MKVSGYWTLCMAKECYRLLLVQSTKENSGMAYGNTLISTFYQLLASPNDNSADMVKERKR